MNHSVAHATQMWSRNRLVPHTRGMDGGRATLVLFALLAASCGESRGTLVSTGAGAPWRPSLATSWQVQLTGALDTSIDVAVYDVDLFDTSAAAIEALRAAGRRVICYVSVGTYEPWRADATSFSAAALGEAVAGFPNERWIDTRDAAVRTLMAARLDLAAGKKCDGVDLSNVSPDGAATGFSFATADVESYGRWLAGQAHARGLGAGLGGGADVAGALAADFDWALTEGCLGDGTCGAYAGFAAAGKVVFGVEFGAEPDATTICPAADEAGLDALIKNRSYDAFRVACP
jgi:hypothetical protein